MDQPAGRRRAQFVGFDDVCRGLFRAEFSIALNQQTEIERVGAAPADAPITILAGSRAELDFDGADGRASRRRSNLVDSRLLLPERHLLEFSKQSIELSDGHCRDQRGLRWRAGSGCRCGRSHESAGRRVWFDGRNAALAVFTPTDTETSVRGLPKADVASGIGRGERIDRERFQLGGVNLGRSGQQHRGTSPTRHCKSFGNRTLDLTDFDVRRAGQRGWAGFIKALDWS